MNNFGVIELAGAKTTSAPGWAYVPDTAIAPGSAGIQPVNRKRARNPTGGGPSLRDLTARQENKIRKEVEALGKDGSRDNTIPLPAKSSRTQTKFTPNVRKVMQSQKTFANHLDDYLALQALEAQPSSNASKRPGVGKKDTAASTPRQSTHDDDVAMTDDLPPVLPPPCKAPPAPHPSDGDPLLASRVPEMPSDAELRGLLAHPPLSYLEALGNLDDRYPTRVFCEVCGYWGRVRCLKCGTRVCALDCLETHREECVTRYGL
ncbi:HIT zinc finger family protein [Metarhizium brunneum]